jgi:WD40 repeat protein
MSAQREIRTLQVGTKVLAISWSPDGTMLAVGGADGLVEVWTADGRRIWSRREHRGSVWGLSWSKEGSRIVSGASDGTLHVREASNGDGMQRFGRGNGPVFGVQWSPDGRRLACGYGTDQVEILDAQTGERLIGCPGHGRFVEALAWSPEGSRLASGSVDKAVRVWDANSGASLLALDHTSTVRSVDWSPEGRRLVSGSGDPVVRVWDAHEGRCLLECRGHTAGWIYVAWCPNSEMVASAARDETVRLWSTRTGDALACLHGHSGSIWRVAFSPDGHRLASASADGTVRIWDVSDLHAARGQPDASSLYVDRHAATVGRRAMRRVGAAFVPRLANAEGMCLGILKGNATQWAGAVALSSDGRTMIAGHPDGSLRLWDLATGSTLWESAEKHSGVVQDVVFSPQERLVASGSDDGVMLWEPATGHLRGRCEDHRDSVWRLSWSRDGGRLASASADNALRVWEVDTDPVRLLWTGTDHTSGVRGVCWSPDGLSLASAAQDSTIRIWDGASGECRHSWEAHSSTVMDVRYSPDGRFLASASYDGQILIWEAGSYSEVGRCRGHSGQVLSVAWSPDGRHLASAGDEGDPTVRIWDAVTGRELAQHAFTEEYAWRVAWSADGAFLASSHRGDVFRLWDTSAFASPRVETARSVGLPHELADLPSALASLHRMGLHPPLSLVQELLQLTGGRAANSVLASHPGIRSLIDLRWPLPARVGLAALLLSRVPLQGWEPSDDLAPARLREDLTLALSGESCEPEAPPIPVAALQQAADRIDERTLTLLQVLGPEAVATEPGLVLRLGARVGLLPALTAPRRRLLGMRLSRRGGTGAGQGVAGAGAERVGIERRGDPRFLLPWQLELPQEVFASRYQRGELLYRAGVGDDPPRLRPAVLVLDVSPPSYGPVEATTRLAAHVMGSSLLEAGLGVVLVTVGGPGEVRILEREADLVDVWTLRSLEPASAVRGLRRAAGMREAVKDGQGEPVIVVLSHAYFGLEEDLPAELPGLRGLFVQYPGQRVRPALSALCERWETVGPGETGGLSAALGRLLG